MQSCSGMGRQGRGHRRIRRLFMDAVLRYVFVGRVGPLSPASYLEGVESEALTRASFVAEESLVVAQPSDLKAFLEGSDLDGCVCLPISSRRLQALSRSSPLEPSATRSARPFLYPFGRSLSDLVLRSHQSRRVAILDPPPFQSLGCSWDRTAISKLPS